MAPSSHRSAATGQTLGHFRLIERIGAGGVGEVWRAYDARLERDVALKVLLPGTLSDDRARARFRKEALALSRLSHPGIATVFDFDSQDGTDFLAMEFVPGESLDAIIARGPLSEPELIALAVQIAEALEASHEVGVIHCDLKPANIRVTPRGRVKVLDFGLAQLFNREGGWMSTTHASDPGAWAGTLPYMAPEQLLGQRPDHRTDLNAFGVVLYEMATGRRPFSDTQPAALMYAIVNTAPQPPRRLQPALSPTVEAVILRMLEKSPERRYASARELAVDLQRGTAPTPAPSAADGPGGRARAIESLAVLPLRNLSGDPTQEFFADGMTEALITSLAQLSALRVISRTSVMPFQRTDRTLPEIARALNVDAVVEGSVLKAGDRVRITAQLIEAAHDRHLWAHSYEGDARDVLTLQSDVAQSIADEVRVHVTPQERARLGGRGSVDPKAYDAYLRGRFLWNKRTVPDIQRGITFFNEAIAADPAWAPAYSGLADSYNILGDQHTMPPAEVAIYARAACQRALELDPDLAEAHTSLGYVRMFYDWDAAGAERAFRHALSLNPSYATGRQWYAEFLSAQGRFDEAVLEAGRAHQLDPLSSIIGTALGDTLYFSRRYDEAIAELKVIVALWPDFLHAMNDLGRVLTERGHFDEAIETFHATARLSGGEPRSSAGLGRAYALAGREREAREVLQVLGQVATQRYVSPFGIATIHAALGDTDQAFEHLERAFTVRDTGLVWARVHPRIDPLRSDPRLEALLRRMEPA